MNDRKLKRGDRVAERVRDELMALIVRGAIRDPAVQDCFVSTVKISDDLRHARVYVRMARPESSQREQERAVAALNKAAGYIRRELAPRLALKYQPDLRFYWDAGVDHANRIDELLSEIREEEGGSDDA